MTLIVGLGNPDRQYEKTRHNLGARLVEALRQALELPAWKEQPSLFGAVTKKAEVLLVRPTVFMNESGKTVASSAQWFQVPPERIWIVLDDVDLPFLETRARTSGSAGGHKGLQSALDWLKTENVNRFRIGIGSNRPLKIPSEAYVLQPFTQDEERHIADALPRLVAELRAAAGV